MTTAPSTPRQGRSGIVHDAARAASAPRRRYPAVYLALVTFLLVTLVACGKASYTVEEHLERATRFEQQGDLRAAMIELRSALQMEPDRAAARQRLGAHYLTFLDGVSAESELERAIRLGDDSDATRLLRARAWLLQGKFDEVLEETRLIDAFERDHLAEALTVRGLALTHRQRLTEAADHFGQARAAEPDHAEAAYGIGWVAALRGQRDEARKWVDVALASDPGLHAAWELTGDMAMTERRQRDAIEAYTRAIEASARPISARYKQALARVWIEDYEGAAVDARAMRQLAPRFPDVFYLEGVIQFEQGRFDAAQRAFEGALARQDGHAQARFYLGASHLAQGHWRQAEEHLKRYLVRYPDSRQANRLLALARIQEGGPERGEQALLSVLERDPEDMLALALMGELQAARGQAGAADPLLQRVAQIRGDATGEERIRAGLDLIQQGNVVDGIAELEAAVEADPGLERLEIALIKNYLQEGEHEKAFTAIERLAARRPDSPVPSNLRAIAHLSLGELMPAIGAFEEALAIAPGDVTASLNLAQFAVQRGDLTEGRALLRGVIDREPGQLQALMQMAALEGEHAQNMPAAAGWLERAVETNPDALEPALLLARYHLFSAEPSKTLAIAGPQLERHRDNPVLLDMVARAQLTLGRFEEGLTTLDRLEAIEPDSAEIQLLRGNASLATGDAAAARSAYELAMVRDPGHVEAGLALARLEIGDEAFESAGERIRRLREEHPRDVRVMVLQGELALEQGEYGQAVRHYREAQQHHPASPHLIGLARSQWLAGDRETSVRTLGDWIEIHPEDVAARHRHANYLMQMERDADARRAYEALLERDPRNPLALNNLAMLLRDSDPERAIRHAEEAHRVAPESVEIMDTLGTLHVDHGDRARGQELLERARDRAPARSGS